jgi:hypothetical protein
MHRTQRDRRLVGHAGRALRLLIILALGAMVIAGLGACGGDAASGDESPAAVDAGVTGTYKFDSGTEEGMEAFTLTLNDDETFTLTQPDPEGGEDVGIGGTYAVDGDTISLTNDEGSESETGTIEGEKLVFETITWVKQ